MAALHARSALIIALVLFLCVFVAVVQRSSSSDEKLTLSGYISATNRC